MPDKRRSRRQRDNFDNPTAPADTGYEAFFSQIEDALPSTGAAIVAAGDHIDIIGRFRLSPVGVQIDDQTTVDEWRAFFEAVKRITDSIQWIVGDLAAFGRDYLRLKYEDIAEMTGYAVKTLYVYADVSRSVDFAIRMANLTFGHHQAVAGLAPPEQTAWLQTAHEEKLSVAALRARINNTPVPGSRDPYGVKDARRRFANLAHTLDKLDANDAVDIARGFTALHDLRDFLDKAEDRLLRAQHGEKLPRDTD